MIALSLSYPIEYYIDNIGYWFASTQSLSNDKKNEKKKNNGEDKRERKKKSRTPNNTSMSI